VRKISKTLALMGLLAPLGANALGIGDIRLHSALNQTLNAEIPLVTSANDDVSGMKVTLASPEAFARAGIERHYSLFKLRFTPQQSADGSYVIKVTSSESIREPFLNFMIEVYWPQGRLQREFTVLLDPPASYPENDLASNELPEAQTYQRSYERPIQRQAVAEPVRPRVRRPITVPSATEAPAAPAEPIAITGTQYGPINRNETLWSIAQQFNQDASISQQKMLTALYKANPQAFYKNNINALKAGETITIPDRETIIRLTGAPSGPQTLRSTANRPQSPKREETGLASNEPAGDSQGQLKLLAPSASKTKEEAAASGTKGKTPEELALETTAEAVKHENEEIRKRLADFDQKLSAMQRLLTLKDEQIATLQAQKEPAKQASPSATTAPSQPSAPIPTAIPPSQPTAPAITAPAPSAIEQAKPQQPPQAPEQPKLPPQEAASPAAPAPQAGTPPIPQAPPQAPQPPPVSKPPVAQQAKPARPPVTTAPKEEEGFLSAVLEQPAYLIGGGTSLLMLTLITAVWIKRRRAAMIDETESILTMSDREKTLQLKRTPIPLDTSPSNLSEQSTTARSSFLSEFTPSDFDALGGEMEEVDPISEADVYLAYGRYKQAEELIRSAIAQNPERDECKLKLLEIHYATENAQAFEKFAQELAPTHKETKPDFWEKVAEMGEELCPDSPLFGAGKAPSTVTSNRQSIPSALPENTENTEENDYFDLKDLEEAYSHATTTDKPTTDRPVDTEENNDEPKIAYDFFATETPEHTASNDLESIPDIQLPNNVLSFDKAQATIEDEPMDFQNKTLDDILAELGVLSDSDQSTSEKESDPVYDSNGIDYTIELESLREKANTDDYEAEDSTEYVGLTEMDEEETKLDLAKAYFEMGDVDSAKVILEHVTQFGNEAQKDEAWTLLASLSKKEVNSR